jgi:cytidine deaminase
LQPSSDLFLAAFNARANAYAPYSGYRVGAAILDDLGKISIGCNVENVSFGATVCAERNAIGLMLVGGGTKVQRLALVTQDGGVPCGICLQCLLEFGRGFEVEIYAESRLAEVVSIEELMPRAFSSPLVDRT